MKRTTSLLAFLLVLVMLMSSFVACLPSGEVAFKDDLPYLEFFANGGSVVDFMSDISVWGEDLTAYEGFKAAVEENIAKIKAGECLI